MYAFFFFWPHNFFFVTFSFYDFETKRIVLIWWIDNLHSEELRNDFCVLSLSLDHRIGAVGASISVKKQKQKREKTDFFLSSSCLAPFLCVILYSKLFCLPVFMFIILFPLGSTKKKNARSSLKSKSIALTYADFAKTNTEEGCLVEKTCLSVIDIIAFLYIVYMYINTKG